MKTPYIGALVLLGLIAGAFVPGLSAGVFPFVTLYVLLPALVFEGAWQLDGAALRAVWRPVLILAIPGVVLTAAIVAWAVHAVGGVGWPAALLLGAILSATDPVAVIAVFRRLPIPKSLATIVEAESLLNDGVAVLIYRAVMTAALAGASMGSLGATALGCVVGAGMGVACGWVLGALAGSVVQRADAAAPIASAVAAFGAYAIATAFAWSGIFAVIACAMVLHAALQRSGAQNHTIGVIWRVLAIGANVVLFFGIGAAVEPAGLLGSWPVIVVALLAVALARLILSYGLLAIVPGVRGSSRAIVSLAGLRGALALALALGLPAGLPARSTIVAVTFAVVAITLIVSALTYERTIGRFDFS